MAIKYEIQKLKNAQGKGDERRFVRIYEQEPMTADELQTQIQDNCSLLRVMWQPRLKLCPNS